MPACVCVCVCVGGKGYVNVSAGGIGLKCMMRNDTREISRPYKILKPC